LFYLLQNLFLLVLFSGCTCNGHAYKCRFDLDLYVASGNRTGGVCIDCQHNTEGRHCASCKPGYFRRLDSELSDQDVCQGILQVLFNDNFVPPL